ncbi:MAG TPA: hypothetical protein VFF73_00825, partial [Planctomycetota bacterium]|nr:hypothetical protein [Planctomycetota bacterium]
MGWFHSLTSFVSSNWKTIAVVAAGTVIFGAALVLTGGTAALLAPTLGQLLVAGVASGMGSQLVSDLLNGQTPGWDIVKAGAVSGVITVATAGLGRFVPGLATPLENPWAQRAVVSSVGGVAGAGAQVLSNAIDGRPLGEHVLQAAGQGAVTTTLASEGIRIVAPRVLGTPAVQERVPTLTQEEAAIRSRAAAAGTARDLRSPDGTPLPKSSIGDVPRGVAAFTDRVTGETTVGVTGGPLNAKMAQVFEQQGIDLPALQKNLDAQGLQDALRTNQAIREALSPTIADQVVAMKPE